MRVLELASSSAHAGGSAVLDPEQLRFEQRLDDRGAIDGNEGALPAATQLVNLARDELLAGPRFPFDQDREIGARDALDSLADGPNRQARADERRRTVSPSARGRYRPPAVRAFQLQQESRHLRCRGEHLPRPIVHRTLRIEHRDETRTSFHRQRRQFARDDMRPFGRFALLAEGDGRSTEKRAQRFFEPLPHEPRLPDRRQSGRERGQHHLGRTSPLPVTRGSRHPSSLRGARADS